MKITDYGRPCLSATEEDYVFVIPSLEGLARPVFLRLSSVEDIVYGGSLLALRSDLVYKRLSTNKRFCSISMLILEDHSRVISAYSLTSKE